LEAIPYHTAQAEKQCFAAPAARTALPLPADKVTRFRACMPSTVPSAQFAKAVAS